MRTIVSRNKILHKCTLNSGTHCLPGQAFQARVGSLSARRGSGPRADKALWGIHPKDPFKRVFRVKGLGFRVKGLGFRV